MSSSLKLFNYGTLIQSLDSEMSTLSTFGSHTDVTFDGVPYICTSVERKETSVTLTTVEEIFRSHGTKKTTSRRIVYPGITFKMDDTTTRQCNQHRQSIERNL
uniref:Gamma-glutamylcyclotransferase family protein n=1 Tax=Heterorhabditis bacteriophora TaxID=37862 RepID=A0A1I7WF29_HETBA